MSKPDNPLVLSPLGLQEPRFPDGGVEAFAVEVCDVVADLHERISELEIRLAVDISSGSG